MIRVIRGDNKQIRFGGVVAERLFVSKNHFFFLPGNSMTFNFLPFNRMQERILRSKSNSNSEYFQSLLYGYEFTFKTVIAAFVASINDDKDRHRYRLEHSLVRASGVGDWEKVLFDLFSGPASSFLDADSKSKYRQEITEKVSEKSNDWRYQAASTLRDALLILSISKEPMPKTAAFAQWFRDFPVLRNKTRGHGAQLQTHIDDICEDLEASLYLVMKNFSLFSLPWAHLKQNLSGKYNVSEFCSKSECFAELRTQKNMKFDDGVYLKLDTLRKCNLIFTNQDHTDFFLPNGGFGDKTFEVISYITGSTKKIDAKPYLQPVDPLPGSVTEAKKELELTGKDVFSNIPEPLPHYIERLDLQDKLYKELLSSETHPIITLDGRGGVGKTSTTLRVVHQLINEDACPFRTVMWFSARDIDLTESGAKPVRPDGISIDDFAKEYIQLFRLPCRDEGSREDFSKVLQGKSENFTDYPVLFVFDNFETVMSPEEVYKWIDTFIRLPNKVLITTRIRKFRADYPINVGGMNENECRQLIGDTSSRLGITSIVNEELIRNIISESEGHPYVINMLLGEIKKNPQAKKIERIMASQDDILDALFERTYSNLSHPARKVFLTLSGWKNIVPELAIEAVLIRPGNERMDVSSAIQEIINCSLANETEIEGMYCISLPLASRLFGKRKLDISPESVSIKEDISILMQFGSLQKDNVPRGISDRISAFMQALNRSLDTNDPPPNQLLPVAEYIARRIPRTWIELAEIIDGRLDHYEKLVPEYLIRYLERDGKDDSDAWKNWLIFTKEKIAPMKKSMLSFIWQNQEMYQSKC